MVGQAVDAEAGKYSQSVMGAAHTAFGPSLAILLYSHGNSKVVRPRPAGERPAYFDFRSFSAANGDGRSVSSGFAL